MNRNLMALSNYEASSYAQSLALAGTLQIKRWLLCKRSCSGKKNERQETRMELIESRMGGTAAQH
jgi:hypothetical protein